MMTFAVRTGVVGSVGICEWRCGEGVSRFRLTLEEMTIHAVSSAEYGWVCLCNYRDNSGSGYEEWLDRSQEVFCWG